MVKKGSSSFSASSVARSGVVLSRAVEKTFSLKEEVSCLRHHVSVLSCSLHLYDKDQDAFCKATSAGFRRDSPFSGDDSVLPPPPDKGVAGGVAVVRLPSHGIEAVRSVASSVASSRSGHLIVVTLARGVRRKGSHLSLALGSSPPSSGRVEGEVDFDDDFVMGSTVPDAEPGGAVALRSAVIWRNVLCRNRNAEWRGRDVERMA